jgi:hypothetical protein
VYTIVSFPVNNGELLPVERLNFFVAIIKYIYSLTANSRVCQRVVRNKMKEVKPKQFKRVDNFVPKSFGVSIPSNPQDLMKLIHSQNKKRNSALVIREQMQATDRESFEIKLMAFEDFFFNIDEVSRIHRYYENLRM